MNLFDITSQLCYKFCSNNIWRKIYPITYCKKLVTLTSIPHLTSIEEKLIILQSYDFSRTSSNFLDFGTRSTISQYTSDLI